MMEIGEEQAGPLASLLAAEGFTDIEARRDLAGRERYIAADGVGPLARPGDCRGNQLIALACRQLNVRFERGLASPIGSGQVRRGAAPPSCRGGRADGDASDHRRRQTAGRRGAGERRQERGAAGPVRGPPHVGDGGARECSRARRCRHHPLAPRAPRGRDLDRARRRHHGPRGRPGEPRGAVRAGLHHARIGARAGAPPRPGRRGAGCAAGRLRDRRAPHRSAPEGLPEAGRRHRDQERLRGGAGEPPEGGSDHDGSRHGDGHGKPHDGGRARRRDDGARERGARAGGGRPRAAPRGDGRADRRSRDGAHRDRGRSGDRWSAPPDHSRPDRGGHAPRRRRDHGR